MLSASLFIEFLFFFAIFNHNRWAEHSGTFMVLRKVRTAEDSISANDRAGQPDD